MSNCHFSFLFLFARQTFSEPRKGCLGKLAASWGGRRFDYPFSQPWTHLMLLCRGRAECCIFLSWGSCCQPFSSPMLCFGQLPCPGSPRGAGRCGYGNSSTAFSWLHKAQPQLALGDSPQSNTALMAHMRLECALGFGMGLSIQRLTQDAVWSIPDEPLATSRKKKKCWRNVSGFLPCFKPPHIGKMSWSERNKSVLFNSIQRNRLGPFHNRVPEIPEAQDIPPA